jgi:hypothetical protein
MTAKKPGHMSGPKILEAVEWRLSFGDHPLLIAQELHRSPGAIERLARVYGNEAVRRQFVTFSHEQKVRHAA